MKNLLTTVFLLACIPMSLYAQETSGDQKFIFGLKATPTICWTRVDAEAVKNDGIKVGFTYGLVTEFRISNNYAFGTGVDVSYRGGKYKYDIPGLGVVKVDQSFQFIDVPIYLKLRTNEIGYIRYHGQFGFLPGFIVKATEDVDHNYSDNDDRKNRSNQSDFGFFSVGLLVGGGLEYNLGGSTSVTASIVYQNGFIDIWDIEDAQMNTDYITLNLGVFF